MYENRFTGDFKSGFIFAVDELLSVEMPTAFRIHSVELLTESYFQQTGRNPDAQQLERLADFILRDDLSDPSPDKVTNTEYPFLSVSQMKLRSGREMSGGDVAHYTPDKKHQLNGKRMGASRDSYFINRSENTRTMLYKIEE